ncbi:MAG TPA: ATP-binding protein [Candidatus Polarisedimenticolia bacterium]|nr:ATP-binding protein [Candidatus Polarisedimenticolia bacterium]
MSLRLRLALALTCAALVPMAVVAGRPLLSARRHAAEEGARRLDQARRQAAVLVRREQADLRGRVERAASDLAADRAAPRALAQGPASTVRALVRLLGERHGLDHLELRGADGVVLAVHDPLGSPALALPPASIPPDEVAIADLPLKPLPPPRAEDQAAPEPPSGDDAPDRPLPSNPPERGMVAMRTVSIGGESYEVLGARRLGAEFLAAVSEVTGSGSALVGPDGATVQAGMPVEESGADAGFARASSEARLRTDVPVASGGWSVRVEAAPGDAAAVRRELLVSLKNVAPVALLAAAIIGLLLAEGISRPVRALADRAEAISAERAGGPLSPVHDRDEVRGLTRSFDRMLEALSESEARRLSAERVAAWQEVARRVAHEVRNALSPIRLAVENLRRTRERAPADLDRALREEGTAILEEVESLRRLVEEFSLFARLPGLRVAPCDLAEVARQALALAGPRLQALGVAVEIEDGGTPHTVRGDADFLGRALGNVIANALDALERAPEKRLRLALRAGSPSWEEIEVRDTGPGFAKEVAGRMFEPYVTTRAESGGTGLGLALVQRVVTGHGGTVGAGASPGGGAYVLMRLPIAGPSAASPESQESPGPPADDRRRRSA